MGGYVRGDAPRIHIGIRDPETGEPVTPAEIVVDIKPPTGANYGGTLTGGDVKPKLDDDFQPVAGDYYFDVSRDTLLAGRSYYEVRTTDPDGLFAGELVVTASKVTG